MAVVAVGVFMNVLDMILRNYYVKMNSIKLRLHTNIFQTTCTRYGNVQAAKALLELGATTDVTTLEQQVPQNDHQGSPTDHQTNATFDHLKNSDVVSPLLLATQNGHIGVVELLVLWSCGLDHTTNDGKTALYCAAQYGDFDMVQMLLYNGADPNIKDKFGFIALHPVCGEILIGFFRISFETLQ